MQKQWLRKKPFLDALFPLPWWIGFIAILALLIWAMNHFTIPHHIETRV